jgi:hypothetical protein
VAQKYPHEITVYIWKYRKTAGLFPSSHFGHVAVRLRNVPPKEKSDVYISFWPKGGASRADAFNGPQGASLSPHYQKDKVNEMSDQTERYLDRGQDSEGNPFAPRDGQRQYYFDADWTHIRHKSGTPTPTSYHQRRWGQSANEKIRLPAAGLGTGLFGLDIVRMYRWWHVFRRTPELHYKLKSHTLNCAGVAALALMAGMADAYAKPPTPVLFMDPNQICRWAKEVEQAIVKLNSSPTRIGLPGLQSGFKRQEAGKLMSVSEWKVRSAVGVSVLARRSGAISKIDGLLAQYHTTPWEGSTDDETTSRFTKKVQLLKDMMTEVHSYLAMKPLGKRNEAVLVLGEQIISIIDERFPDEFYNNFLKWDRMYPLY